MTPPYSSTIEQHDKLKFEKLSPKTQKSVDLLAFFGYNSLA